MTEKVTTIRPTVLREDHQPDQALIQFLRDRLAEAEAGTLQGCCFIGKHSNQNIADAWSGNISWQETYFGLAHLRHKLDRHCFGEENG